jgi:hypothetical protein
MSPRELSTTVAVQACWVLDAFANSAPTSLTPLVVLDFGIRVLTAVLAVRDARRRIASATAGNPSASTATAAIITTFPENMTTSVEPGSKTMVRKPSHGAIPSL